MPDRDHGGTPGWRERLAVLAEHASKVEVRAAADRAYPLLAYYEVGPALAADIRAALAASSPQEGGGGAAYVATSGPFAGLTVGPGLVATRDAETTPLDQRREADCLNLLGRCRMVFDNIASGRMDANDAIDMAQYVADAIGHSVTDQAPIENMRHRCLGCGDYFDHDHAAPAGVQVDREAAVRIQRALTYAEEDGLMYALAQVYVPPQGSDDPGDYREHRFRADIAAALAPLLGTPEP